MEANGTPQMVAFPVCKRLQINGYGLYPGTKKDHVVDISIGPGLTLILGANGLGKTTLTTLLFRLLTGNADLRSGGGESLGTTALDPIELGPDRRREFAQRVRDGAANALATLTFSIGCTTFEVTRSLRDLQLVQMTIDGNAVELSERTYRDGICNASSLSTFGDFLLVLRHLIFYFEDRRSLVWDNAAQRQVLRALFLNPGDARQWTELERAALQLDSELRNLNAVLTKHERRVSDSERRTEDASAIRVQIDAVEQIQGADVARQEMLGLRGEELDGLLTQSRLSLLRAEQRRDTALRTVEHAQLSAIERAFPAADESARYIFAQLVSDGICRACGQRSPDAVERMNKNLASHLCAVCSLPLPVGEVIPAGVLASHRIERAVADMEGAHETWLAAQRGYREVANEYTKVRDELAALGANINQRHLELSTLYSQLPPEEAELFEQRKSKDALRGVVESLKAQLADAQNAFAEFVQERTNAVHAAADDLKDSFQRYASGFLLEQISLSWAPTSQRIGQFRENPYIEFPAFKLDVSGSDFAEPVRRDGPGQVSESQREFIDLAFRMALIKVAGADGAGTILIDAPESSLDAVFVSRAADVLGRFALDTSSNRLIVTSNISPGNLLPRLIAVSTAEGVTPQIVDLFDIGVPTAAINTLNDEYAAFRNQLKARLEGERLSL